MPTLYGNHSSHTPVLAMRHVHLMVGLTVVPALLAAQQPTFSRISVPVVTCPRADSLQGALEGKPRKVNALRRSDSPTIHLDVSTDQVGQTPFSSPSLQIGIRADTGPAPRLPEGSFGLQVTGDAGRRILATRDVPELTIELADSVTLRPGKVALGGYDGPSSFAMAPLSAQLAPNSLLAMVRSDSLVVRAGLTHLRPSPSFRSKLRDAYRIATCGYGRLD